MFTIPKFQASASAPRWSLQINPSTQLCLNGSGQPACVTTVSILNHHLWKDLKFRSCPHSHMNYVAIFWYIMGHSMSFSRKIDPELWKNVFFEHQILPLDAIGILPHPLWISSDLQRSSQSGQGSPGKCPRSAARSSNCTADWGLWASKPGQTRLWQLWLRFFKTWQNRDSGFGHWKRLCLDMFSIV